MATNSSPSRAPNSTLVPTSGHDSSLSARDTLSGLTELTLVEPVNTRTPVSTVSRGNADLAPPASSSNLALRTSPFESVGSDGSDDTDSDSEINFEVPSQDPEVVPAPLTVAPSGGSSQWMHVDSETSFRLPRQTAPIVSPVLEAPSRRSSRASSRQSVALADRMYDDLAEILRRQSAEKEVERQRVDREVERAELAAQRFEREKQIEREKCEKEMEIRLNYERRLAAAEFALMQQKYEHELASPAKLSSSTLAASGGGDNPPSTYLGQGVSTTQYVVARPQAATALSPASFTENTYAQGRPLYSASSTYVGLSALTSAPVFVQSLTQPIATTVHSSLSPFRTAPSQLPVFTSAICTARTLEPA